MASIRPLIRLGVAPLVLAGVADAKPMKKQHAHDHGHAKLSIAVDDQSIAFDLDTPAQGLYGFEYEPRTDVEKSTYADANAKFEKTPQELFVLGADYGCKVTKATIKKEAAEPGETGAAAHSDMNASVVFQCTKSLAGAKVTIALIKAFPLIKEVKVQIATATKQAGESVTKPEQELTL